MKVIICSGGTGGHMFPACVLFEKMEERYVDAHIVTDARGNDFCKNIRNKTVMETVRFSKKDIFSFFINSVKNFYNFFRICKENRPDVIIGFGGLFTVIPIVVAKIFGVKIVVYEQNAVLGKANKLLEKISDLKISSFKIDNSWKLIASPVRKEFISLKKTSYSCDGKLKIVVIGGSQGAISFDKIIPNAISLIDEEKRKNIEIVQQVSSININELHGKYEKLGVKSKLLNFVHNIAEEMLSSQLVICRSGASTLGELSYIGRPAILIPYPNATENHQFCNALHYKNRKAAWIVEENKDSEQNLASIIANILNNRELLKISASNMISEFIGDSTDVFIESVEKLCVT